jgi:transposase
MTMTKAKRARYTLEFKQEVVRLVESGQTIAAAARSVGMVEQTLFNWVKASREGTLKGADRPSKVSAEQMEISRLRAELARVKMSYPACDSGSTGMKDDWKRRLVPVRKAIVLIWISVGLMFITQGFDEGRQD